ncbi:MAG: C_GCAxxG_C_C family protein [Spirochaetes bacterium]|nr:C_GCAxxG_C_C family protein [Spirochaetota bacterium]
MDSPVNDTRKVFSKMGSCSRTFCFLLNREFGCPMEAEERAADPLAGGIVMRGHQCGMLWGSTLAAGAESYRAHSDRGRAVASAITAARYLRETYSQRAGSVNCRDVCGYDLTRRLNMLKFMVKFILHINRHCFDLAEQWAPEAMRAAAEGISGNQEGLSLEPVSCASEVVKRMGAGDMEAVMVAGLAGGLGLGGHGCGALAAAIWLKCLRWCREHPGKSAYGNPEADRVLKVFTDAVGEELRCEKLVGRRFTSIDDHTEFIQKGGCAKIIDALARS